MDEPPRCNLIKLSTSFNFTVWSFDKLTFSVLHFKTFYLFNAHNSLPKAEFRLESQFLRSIICINCLKVWSKILNNSQRYSTFPYSIEVATFFNKYRIPFWIMEYFSPSFQVLIHIKRYRIVVSSNANYYLGNRLFVKRSLYLKI